MDSSNPSNHSTSYPGGIHSSPPNCPTHTHSASTQTQTSTTTPSSSTHAVVIHVAHSALPGSEVPQATPQLPQMLHSSQSISPRHAVSIQTEPNVVDNIRGQHLRGDAITPFEGRPIFINPLAMWLIKRGMEKQEIDRILGAVQTWATDQSVNPDIQKARAHVYQQLSEQLTKWVDIPAKMGKMKIVVKSNIFPSFIFREKFIQDKLQWLKIKIYQENEETESDLFDFQGIENLRNLEVLTCVGVKQIPESIGTLDKLRYLTIKKSNISILPESIENLVNLQHLTFDRNKKLIKLPNSLVRLHTLKSLSLKGCVALESLPDSSPNPLHATDTSYRFGNLRALRHLNLNGCSALKAIPQSICELKALEDLWINDCAELKKLPERMDALEALDTLRFGGTKIESLPHSLYRLALNKPPGFLPSPWNETVQWMCTALQLQASVLRVPLLSQYLPPYNITGDTLRIEIRRGTAIPFAQEHLSLLVKALESSTRRDSHNRDGLAHPPKNIFVTYGLGQDPIDLGGLRRERCNRMLLDCAEQMKDDLGPIFVYKEDKNCFILERAINRTEMHPSEIEFCQNIGKLIGAFLFGFASFPNSPSNACKIGNIFPEYFYTWLISIALDPCYTRGRPRPYLIPSFAEMHQREQESICYLLSCSDQNGLKDGTGKLLFDTPGLSDFWNHPNSNTSNDNLYKIWKLLNHYEDVDTIRMFPSLVGFVQEEFEAYNAFPEGMLEAFRNALHADEATKEKLKSTLSRYRFEQYHRQCEPLVYVAQGFQSVIVKYFSRNASDVAEPVMEYLKSTSEAMGLSRYSSPSARLSYIVQGPPFTFEAFRLLMQRCVINPDTPIAIQENVRTRMNAIIGWYLNETTDDQNDQRKEMLRCMNGTDVIIMDMRPLIFGGPTNSGLFSIFHTCFGSVDLGNALMSLDPVTQRQQLIDTWLEHIDLAMQGGISRQ